MSSEMKFYGVLAFAIIAFVVFINVTMHGSKKADAIRVLEYQGIQVESVSYAWFGCAEDDTFRFKFKGTNDKGNPVEGSVCSGLLKGATVRFN